MDPEATQSSFEYFVSMAFGSDELTPYTAQYSWNSNQMAHAMMGFFLAIFWLFFVISHRPGTDGEPKAPTGWRARLLGWFQRRPMWLYVVALFGSIPLKEAADVLLDASNYSGSPVSANMPRLLFDSVTDISFWWTGMFLAALMIGWFQQNERALRGGVPTVGLILCVLFWWKFAGPIWQNQKQTFDNSGMPFNYVRLAVQSGRDMIPFQDDRKAAWGQIEAFRTGIVNAEGGKPPQTHFVIFGGTPEDRSRLAVGMGCEYAFKLRGSAKFPNDTESIRALYVSAAALLERPQTLERARLDRLECVVIDDLDVTTRRPSMVDPKTRLQWYKKMAKADPERKVKVEKELIEQLKPGRTPDGKAPPAGTAEQVEVSLAELNEIEKAAPPPPPNPANPSNVLEERLEIFRKLGSKAKSSNVGTIWVLSGFSGPDKTPAHAAWIKRRDDWVKEIAETLGEDVKALKIIELVEPPATKP